MDYELTGGEIKDVIINAVTECLWKNQEYLTMAELIEFAEKERQKEETKII